MTERAPSVPAPFQGTPPDNSIEPNPRTVRGGDMSWFNTRKQILKDSYPDLKTKNALVGLCGACHDLCPYSRNIAFHTFVYRFFLVGLSLTPYMQKALITPLPLKRFFS